MSDELDLNISYRAIVEAARKGKFISYGQLAKANGAEWQKVRYKMNHHLGELVEEAARRGWPMPSSIVVSQANVETGQLDGTAREGFVNAAKQYGFDVADPATFVEEQQQAMFDWARKAPDQLDLAQDRNRGRKARVWIEKTIVQGRQDRQQGPHRLGEALWSPQQSKSGVDIYASMRRAAPGDIVLHLTDNSGFTGLSEVAASADSTFKGISGTDWADQPGYRVQLRNYRELEPALLREDFLVEGEIGDALRAVLDGPNGKGLFYNRKLELNQGVYLSEAPPSLITILNKAYTNVAGRKLIEMPDVDLPMVSVKPMKRTPQNLNTVFYGPPGTGKTFVTAKRAVEICDGGFVGNSQELRARYDKLVSEKRIEFVTFHQTYGYEEFVEGLRPETGDTDDGESGPGFRLVPVDGVLKRIAEQARNLPSRSEADFDPSGRKVFKVSLGRSNNSEDDYLREECLEKGYVLLGYGGRVDWSDNRFNTWDSIAERWRQEPGEEGTDSRHGNIVFTAQLRLAMEPGDIVLASQGNRKIQAIGIVDGPYEFVPRQIDNYHHRRRVKWLWKDKSGHGVPVDSFYPKNLTMHPIYEISTKLVNWDALLPYLKTSSDSGPRQPHVLIIDEINRANISKVMGELITLLEEDKREGAENEISVTLPHSKRGFSLPANLHIIGTMNTADRSIALLDTALRRRFHFEEMPPDPDTLRPIDGVDVANVLRAINSRLEWFLGSDQLIGHAWFIKAENLPQLDELMANKSIPLLREYFHEDLDRVRAVLGGGDGFLKRERIPTPPGVDDYGDERWRYVDRYRQDRLYGRSAYDEVVKGVHSGTTA